ncbi:MAG TPA: hypothetical protein VMV49_01685 [Candidatus Deferrimicrobium sp.]|nr:hypothetical protein [Candidatus Deferrimicrobium sp.]
MLPKNHYKRYFIICLLISSIFITIAGYRTTNKIDSKVEQITKFNSIKEAQTPENLTYVTIPLTINKIKGTTISVAEVEKNIEELNEIFKNEILSCPVAIFVWDHIIHEIADPEGNDDGVVDYNLESRDSVREAAAASAEYKGMSITLCNSAGRPDLTAITTIGESHGAILTTGTDGSDWAHEMQHALGLDHGASRQADEDMDGNGVLDEFDDVGYDANHDGLVNNEDRNYNLYGNKRLRLFNGLTLTAQDFTMEQTYQTHIQRVQNAYSFGAGIISGIELSDKGSDTTNSTNGTPENKTNVDLKQIKIRTNITDDMIAHELQWALELIDAPIENCSYEICIDNNKTGGDPTPGLYFGADLRLSITTTFGILDGMPWIWNAGFWQPLPGPIQLKEESVNETIHLNNATGSRYVGAPPVKLSAAIDDLALLQILGIGDLGLGEFDMWGVSQWFYDPSNETNTIYDIITRKTVVDMRQSQALISASPTSIQAGNNVTVNGTGFPPNSNVTLNAGGQNVTVQANASGSISANLTLPATLVANYTIISAVGINNTGNAAYVGTFTGVPNMVPITPNPSLTGTINLNWNIVYQATFYYVYRNTSFISSVAGLTPLTTSNTNTYQDIILLNGTYFYAVLGSNSTWNSTLSNCVNVTVTIPPAAPTLSSQVFVYVNSTIYPKINASLVQFKADLESVGYILTLINFSSPTGMRFYDAQRIKQQCVSSYSSGLEGIIFVGQLPYVNYEIYNTPFPCDLYFMDLDGQWSDFDLDTYYDNHSSGTGDRDPEIWFGRIDATTMTGRNETEALIEYFQRNHLYRNGTLQRPHSSLIYIDDSWSAWANEWGNESVHAYTNQTIIATDSITNDTNWETELTHSYEWVHLFVHSYPNQHVFYPSPASGYTSCSEIRSITTQALFFLLFACSAADFSQSDNIATEYLFSNNTLATFGCTRTGGMFEPSKLYKPLGNGSCLGESLKRWFSDCTLSSSGLNNPANSYGVTLLGDPTLKILYGPLNNPPVLSSLTRTNSTVHLNWTKVTDASIYYIYRNTSKITSTTGLTPIGWTTNNYTDDLVPSGGTYYYVIVAGNDFCNSTLSNCENITVPTQLQGPLAPNLYPISPNPDDDGIIHLNWSSVIGATRYLVYRATYNITSLFGLTPIANITQTICQDNITTNNVYYYVIVAVNASGNSPISNCENVTVSIHRSSGVPGFSIIPCFIVITAIAVIYLTNKKKIKIQSPPLFLYASL